MSRGNWCPMRFLCCHLLHLPRWQICYSKHRPLLFFQRRNLLILNLPDLSPCQIISLKASFTEICSGPSLSSLRKLNFEHYKGSLLPEPRPILVSRKCISLQRPPSKALVGAGQGAWTCRGAEMPGKELQNVEWHMPDRDVSSCAYGFVGVPARDGLDRSASIPPCQFLRKYEACDLSWNTLQHWAEIVQTVLSNGRRVLLHLHDKLHSQAVNVAKNPFGASRVPFQNIKVLLHTNWIHARFGELVKTPLLRALQGCVTTMWPRSVRRPAWTQIRTGVSGRLAQSADACRGN